MQEDALDMTEEQFKKAVQEFVNDYFPFIKNIFSSEEEMLNYGLKFFQIYPPKEAYLEFYHIIEFYQTIKLLVGDDKEKDKNISIEDRLEQLTKKKYQKKEDVLSLIMSISLIEKLTSRMDYIPFSEWVTIEKRNNEEVKRAWDDYNKDYGCFHKLKNFFLNQEYLKKEEQLALLKSVCYFIKKKDNKVTLVPLFCFDSTICGGKSCYDKSNCMLNDCFEGFKCIGAEHGCMFGGSEDCPARSEEKAIYKGIKEFANFLYTFRNGFVHDARIFRLSEETSGSTMSNLFDYVPYTFKYNIPKSKRPQYNGNVSLRLSPNNLIRIIDRNFKKLLDNYISVRLGEKTRLLKSEGAIDSNIISE